MPLGSSSTISLPRRTKVTHACTNCQALKIKCGGKQDQRCSNCVKTNVECVRNPSRDRRRKASIRQRVEVLEDDQALFFRLLLTLRHDNQHVDGLLDYIVHEKPSLSQIKQYMDFHFKPQRLDKTPELLEKYNEAGGSGLPATTSAHRALNIARLCDIPPYRGPAYPWTTVTTDDGFVSHLISLYFTWNHSFSNWIGRDLFLRDLNSGNVNSPFCSPFLVNAILADACWYSSYPESCAVSGDVTTKGRHFWEEARRLLHAEDGKITLPTVQGVAIMSPASCVMGDDGRWRRYAAKVFNAIPVLRAYLEDPFNTHFHGEVTSAMLDHLELGWFNAAIAGCFGLPRDPLVGIPRCARLPVHQKPDETWFPYPLHVDPVPAVHRNCVLNHTVGLGEVIWHFYDGIYTIGQHGRPPGVGIVQVVSKAYEDLLCWRESIPACIEHNENSVPDVLSLHMHYHSFIITALSYPKTSIPNTITDKDTQPSISFARAKCIASAHAISILVTIYTARWGHEYQSVHDFQYFYAALFVLREDLNNPASHDAFLNIANNFVFAAGRWLIIRGMFRHVQVATPEDRKRFGSAYPGFVAVLQQQGDAAMDEFESG
ncbi:hypothetical protein BDW75DRAFT_251532 [Aspergillus navahoensis]